MSADPRLDTLAAELTELGRGVPRPSAGPQVTRAVMDRLAHPPARGRVLGDRLRGVVGTAGNRRRSALVAVVVIVLALLGMPAVRAAVAQWFGFAGVTVRLQPGPRPATASPPPAVVGSTSLTAARDLVGFTPLVPAALGPPQGVSVSADRRVLSMSWTVDGAPVRLDQFDGRLDIVFAKTATGVEYTSVNGSFALWFERPHDVVVVGADGKPRTETARLAGRTLIWEERATTLRLEGDLSRARALEIAASTRPLP